jgi:membrane fusion protein (multidrug efflux system)
MESTKTHKIRNSIILILVIAGLAAAGYFYVKHQEAYPSTDDSYVHANILYIAPQISGRLDTVNVKDFQQVDQGDIIAQINPAPYQAQYDRAQAAYEAATQNNAATNDAILAASASIRSASAQLIDIQQKYNRTITLVRRGVLPAQTGDDVKAELAGAKNNLDAARAKMSQLVKEQGAKGKESPQVKQAAAMLTQAALNLSYTNIEAASSGTLGKVSVHPGSVVAPGQALMPLVEAHSYWIQANFKEDDLEHIKIGMPANIVIDMYPNITFHGTVQSISPASGSSFSLLPPENATGNWVKVSQRFPIRIEVDLTKNDPALRVGASATVTIDTVANNGSTHD